MSLTAPSPTSHPQQPAAQPNSTLRVGAQPSSHTTSKRIASPTPLFVHPMTSNKKARTGVPTYRKAGIYPSPPPPTTP
ncbi:predicted protein [Lichtheimia corymbifera JMRC:FSU:9682]|uniref:Uncharacterized protein n=1 Tax=Lichtheimia corymbifera JMRC:FSU:9682 TaxID=1263082 RepID=A0A068S3M6_9FUNG|nr:predicted protein [Lichtheimia corymbifera JMRC:FSU:9682]